MTGTCGSCHLVPEPGDLTVGLWDTVVLPRMGHFLGRYAYATDREDLLGPAGPNRERLEQAAVYPPEPLISAADWALIRDHYLSAAPTSLPATAFTPLTDDSTTQLFRPRYPELFLSPPSTTFARSVGRRLLLGDVNTERIYLLNEELAPAGSFPLGRGLTDATGFQPGDYAVTIGSFSPTDAPTGSLFALTPRGPRSVVTDLQRPTSLVKLDADGDGTEELLVTEYGKWTGRLSLWRSSPTGGWAATPLAERPGALRVVADTSAAEPTVYVLFGQGREQIVRYVFRGGRARATVIRAFPPSYGSSSLSLTDWNDDGYPDLLYTNGDNADYVSPVKPYHGIRLYLGRPDGTFADGPFLPFPGAYAAAAGDFDGDGRKDLAAVSFFPDYRSSAPVGAVLFQRSGDGTFAARPLPATATNRYLTLDAADHDGDGDLDLLAGCLAMEPVPDNGRLRAWVANGLPAVVWENLSR